MALLIHKYGGTSVGSIERIQSVAERVVKAQSEGNDIVVVLSAMSGETNRLLALADEISADNNQREVDVLVSTGEQVSIALLALAIQAMGKKAKSYLGFQVPIITDNQHAKARIKRIEDKKIKADLAQGYIVIVSGFQGIDEQQNITTLGRGGSDTSAVALAAALKADECQIYTDVNGVYTTDPRVEPKARKMDKITFEEMLEMSSLGSKVLQIRSVEFAGKYNVPLRVLSSFEETGEGTLITMEENSVEAPLVSGIAFDKDVAIINVKNIENKPGMAYKILSYVSSHDIDVDMIVQNDNRESLTNFSFSVAKSEMSKALTLLKNTRELPDSVEITGNDEIVKLSLVGIGMQSHAGVAAKMFEILSKENINILLITTSEIKISTAIDEKYLELAVRALHDGFELESA